MDFRNEFLITCHMVPENGFYENGQNETYFQENRDGSESKWDAKRRLCHRLKEMQRLKVNTNRHLSGRPSRYHPKKFQGLAAVLAAGKLYELNEMPNSKINIMERETKLAKFMK